MLSFITICGLFVLASAQSLDLSFTRLLNIDNNLITLRCENTADGSLVSNPAFFRDGSLFPLPNRQDSPTGVLFRVTRSIEGIYACGLDENASPIQRSQEQLIVSESITQYLHLTVTI